MDKTNQQFDAKISQARKKRIDTLRNRKTGSKDHPNVKPLSDVTNSRLKTDVCSSSNVSNLSKENGNPLSKFIGTPKLCENTQPTISSTPTQHLPCKRNVDHVLNGTNIIPCKKTAPTPLTDITKSVLKSSISTPSYVSNHYNTTKVSHVKTTSTRFLHDHSGILKSKGTIKANIQSKSQSNTINNTQPSDLSASILNPNTTGKRSLPSVNLLNRFSETLEPQLNETQSPYVGMKRKVVNAENPNNVITNKKKSILTSDFVSTSKPVQSVLSGLLDRLQSTSLMPDATTHSTRPSHSGTPEFDNDSQPSFQTEPSHSSIPAGQNGAKPISTDAEYFCTMSNLLPDTTQNNDTISDNSSDSDSDQSDHSQQHNDSDEGEDDDLDDDNLNGKYHFSFNVQRLHFYLI